MDWVAAGYVAYVLWHAVELRVARKITLVEALLDAAGQAPRTLLRATAVLVALLLQRIGRAVISVTAEVRRVVTGRWRHYRKLRRRALRAGAAAWRHPAPRCDTSLQMHCTLCHRCLHLSLTSRKPCDAVGGICTAPASCRTDCKPSCACRSCQEGSTSCGPSSVATRRSATETRRPRPAAHQWHPSGGSTKICSPEDSHRPASYSRRG